MDIEIVYGDDWQGLYSNGSLIMQGHKIELDDVINLINNNLEKINKEYGIVFTEHWCDINWLCDIGKFPDDFDEVKFPDYSRMF